LYHSTLGSRVSKKKKKKKSAWWYLGVGKHAEELELRGAKTI